ncbi:MAG: permease prefix domain 1-containing protein [Coriobacteriia bacterium]|nr:permease prefix domain 1-containing protein [Coriobacteriia bacterium]
METIKLYLDSIFAAAPDTDEVRRVKFELLDNMEEKYHELRSSGVSDNEAIGAVISDFGNVDELFAEIGITSASSAASDPASSGSSASVSATDAAASNYPSLTEAEVNVFLDTYRQSSKGIALGVLLCVMGVISLIGTSSLIPGMHGSLAVALMFLFAIPAVGLFIFYGMRLSNFEDIDEGRFHLGAGQRVRIKMKKDGSVSRDTLRAIVAVAAIMMAFVLLMLSPWLADSLPTLNASTISIPALLLLLLTGGIAAGVFIITGMEHASYDKLLQRGDYEPAKRKSDTIVGAIAAFYWPLMVVIYLAWSFVFSAWHISWAIWPIAGILFGGIAAFIPEARKVAGKD